ncbi:MAG TPA: tetratricopeptide repeat protein [Solirubrobacteraceae bacterium]|nr:tetratricopeptide repeat protein [Solirubrobacteraceae bacterium]
MTRTDGVRHIQQLYRERRYDDAVRQIAATLPRLDRRSSEQDRMLARDVLIQLGQIHSDFGRYSDAADTFDVASSCLPDSEQSFRLRAVALERRYRGAEQDPHNRAQLRRVLHSRLETSIEPLSEDRDAQRLLPLLWARARLLSGPNPDDRPNDAALDKAEEVLAQARRCERLLTSAAHSRRIAITGLRIARLRAGYRGHEAIAPLRAELARVRTETDRVDLEEDPLESPPSGISFEEARIELVAHEWEKSMACLRDVIENSTPTHQASLVCQIYCRRMQGESAEEILRSIAFLLGERSRDCDPLVVNPDLRAELHSERAVLIEAYDPTTALREYELALQRRPRMTFALRGKIRCQYMLGETARALEFAKHLLAREPESEDGPTADVLTEIGQLHLNQRELGVAAELFDRAIEQMRAYGFAYGRKTSALRVEGRIKEAVRFAERTIATEVEFPNSVGSLRVELGDSYLAHRMVNSAIAQFMQAEADAYPIVRERGRGGLIRAYLWKRDLNAARAAFATATVQASGARLEDAAGWFHGTVGNYSQALRHFARSVEGRPYDPPSLVGQARVLRLLGRPAKARRLLERKAESWPEGKAVLLHNEIGWAGVDEREYDAARSRFERVLEFAPKSQAALRGRIVAAARSGCGARELYGLIEDALQRVADNDPRARASVLTEAGTVLLDRGHIPRAREMFHEANELSDSVSQRVIQGHALLKAHILPEALQCAEEAGRLAAEMTGSRIDFEPLRSEIEELLDALVAEPDNETELDKEFTQLCDHLRTTPSGDSTRIRLITLWRQFIGAVRVTGSEVHKLKRQLLHELDQLRRREAELTRGLPRDPDVLLLRGACHLASAAPSAALKAFEDAARAYGAGSLPPVVGKALVLLEQQEYDAAFRCLRPFALEAEGNMRTRELLAWAMLHQEQRHVKIPRSPRALAEGRVMTPPLDVSDVPNEQEQEIARICIEIIDEEPSRVDAYLCLGALAMHRRRTTEALSYLEQATKVAPTLAHPLRENAAALLRIGDYKRASARLAESLVLDPNDPRARLLDGLIALEQDQPFAAMSSLRQAQELDPYEPHAALGLASALQQAGQEAEAIAELSRAINVVPPHRSILLLLARARIRHDLVKTQADSSTHAALSAALEDAVRAARLARTPHDRAEAAYHRGVILYSRHRKAAAVRALRSAIRHDPSLLEARQALSAVRESVTSDTEARLPQRAAYLTMALASVLLVLIVVQSVRAAKAEGIHFHWAPVVYLLTLLGVIAVAGLLPRIARFRLKEIEITIAAPSPTPEATLSRLDFGRMPLSTLFGPSTYRASDVVADLAGVPEWR